MAKKEKTTKEVEKKARSNLRKLNQALQNTTTSKEDKPKAYERQVQEQDPFSTFYTSNNLAVPPYGFNRLYDIYEESDILQACVEAMQRNVDGFGYEIQYVGEDLSKRTDTTVKAQQDRLIDFFDMINEGQSFTSARKQFREDFEVLGIGGFECLRNKRDELHLMYYAPFRNIRMSAKLTDPVDVTYNIRRGGKVMPITVKKRFRKFAQISDTTQQKLRWFKQFGDPRPMDYRTGEFKTSTKYNATEIFAIKHPFGGLVYGMPRWIACVLDVLGRRAASFVNHDMFDNQGIPPILISLIGGSLTDESIESLTDMIQGLRGLQEWNKIAVLEVEPEVAGLDDKGKADIKFHDLASIRKEDLMFEKYQKSAAASVRQRYRLPPMYSGGESEYTYACHSSDTQTLTEKGWKYYWEIGINEKIATLNPATQQIEYKIPNKQFIYKHNGPMIHVECMNVDFMVTLNHKLWLSKYKSNQWKMLTSEDWLTSGGRDWAMQQAPENNSLPEIDKPVFKNIPNNIFLNWCGHVIGDGNIKKGGYPKGPKIDNRIEIRAKKQRKLEVFWEIALKIQQYLPSASVYKIALKDGKTSIIVRHAELHEWCEKNLLTNPVDREKTFPLKMMSPYLFKGLMESDGSWYKNNGEISFNSGVYVTGSKELAERFQILCCSLGFRARYYSVDDPRKNRIPSHRIPFTKCPTNLISKRHSETTPYNGTVYCFDVDNHLFITRRNGKISIHGNSSRVSQSVAEEQIFIPERNEFDEDVNTAIIWNEFGIMDWWFKSKGPQIVGAKEISTGIGAFMRAGALTVNASIELVNRSFGMAIPLRDEPWAELPVVLLTKWIEKGGQLKELTDLGPMEGATPNPEAIENLQNMSDADREKLRKNLEALSELTEEVSE